MKVSVGAEGTIVLKEVFNSIVLETAEGNQLAICMRDDTFEMKLVGTDNWHRVNVQTGDIEKEKANGMDN